MKIKVTVAGLEKIKAKVTRGVHFMGKPIMRKAMQDIGHQLVAQFEANIRTFTPGKVRDLKPATKERKVKAGWSVYPILVASGDMVRSMYSRVRREGTVWVLSVGFKGTDREGARNKDKARGHLDGTGRLPKRDFTTVPPGFGKRVLSALMARAGWKKRR